MSDQQNELLQLNIKANGADVLSTLGKQMVALTDALNKVSAQSIAAASATKTLTEAEQMQVTAATKLKTAQADAAAALASLRTNQAQTAQAATALRTAQAANAVATGQVKSANIEAASATATLKQKQVEAFDSTNQLKNEKLQLSNASASLKLNILQQSQAHAQASGTASTLRNSLAETGSAASSSGGMMSGLTTIVRGIGSGAAGAVGQLGQLGSAASGAVSNGISKLGEVAKTTSEQIMHLGEIGAHALLHVGSEVISLAADYQTNMNRVKFITEATTSEMKAYTLATIDIGKTTTFSSKEASQSLADLAQMGYKNKDATELMKAGANAAMINNISLADATRSLTTTLGAFSLKASDSGRVLDIMTRASQLGKLKFTDFADIMSRVGGVATSAKMPIEGVGSAILSMTNTGMSSIQASQILKGTIVSLEKPNKVAAAAIKEVGLQIYDSSGKMVPYSNIIEQLQTKTAKMTDQQKNLALASIFGKSGIVAINDAVNASVQVYKDASGQVVHLTEAQKDDSKYMATLHEDTLKGADALRYWESEMKNSAGTVDRAGDVLKSGFNYQLKQMKGSVEEALITIGTPFLTPLSNIIAGIGSVVNSFIDWEQENHKLAGLVTEFASKIGSVFKTVLGVVSEFYSGLTNKMPVFEGQRLVTPFVQLGLAVRHTIQEVETVLSRGRDAFNSFRAALAGNWTDAADKIRITDRVFGELGLTVRSIIVHFMNLHGAIQPLLNVIVSGVTGVLGMKLALGLMYPVISLVGSALAGLLSPITLIVAGVGLLAQAWSSNWMGIQQTVGPVVAQIGNALIGLMTNLRSMASSVGTTLLPVFAQFGSSLLSTVVPAVGQFASFMIGSVIPALIEFASYVISNVVPVIKAIADAFVTYIVPGVKSFVDAVRSTLIPTVEALVSGFVSQLRPAFESVMGFIAGTVIPIIGQLARIILTNIVPTVTQLVSILGNLLQPALQFAGQAITQYLIPALTMVGQFISSTVLPALDSMWQFLNNNILPVVAEIAPVIGRVLGPLAGFALGLGAIKLAAAGFSGLIGIVGSFGSALMGMLSSGTTGIATMITGASGLGAVFLAAIPGVAAFAVAMKLNIGGSRTALEQLIFLSGHLSDMEKDMAVGKLRETGAEYVQIGNKIYDANGAIAAYIQSNEKAGDAVNRLRTEQEYQIAHLAEVKKGHLDLIDSLGALNTKIQDNAEATRQTELAQQHMTVSTDQHRSSLQKLNNDMADHQSNTQRLTNSLSHGAGLYTVYANGLGDIARQANDAAKALDGASKAVDDMDKALSNDQKNYSVATQLMGNLNQAFQAQPQIVQDAWKNFEDYTHQVTLGGDAAAGFKAKADEQYQLIKNTGNPNLVAAADAYKILAQQQTDASAATAYHTVERVKAQQADTDATVKQREYSQQLTDTAKNMRSHAEVTHEMATNTDFVTAAINKASDMALIYSSSSQTASNGVATASSTIKNSVGQIGPTTATAVSSFQTEVFKMPTAAASATAKVGSSVQGSSNWISLLVNSGAQMVTGLVNGILSGLGRAQSAGASLAAAAAGGTQTRAQIQSPSKLFFGFGQYMGAGLTSGMSAMDSTVFSAGAKMVQQAQAGTTAATAKAAAQVAGDNVGKNMVKALNATQGDAYTAAKNVAVKAAEGAKSVAPPPVATNVSTTDAGQAGQKTRKPRRTKATSGGADNSEFANAVKMAEDAAKAADAAVKMSEAMEKLRQAGTISRESMDIFALDVSYLTQIFLGAANGFDKDALNAVSTFADTASKVAGAASAMADSLAKLKDYSSIGRQAISDFATDMNALVGEFADQATNFDTNMLAAAAVFADTATKVAGATSAMADALAKVRDWAAVGKDSIFAFAQDVNSLVAEFFNDSVFFSTDMLKAATAFSDTATKVADAASKMADALSKVRNWAAIGKDTIFAFGQDVKSLVAEFYNDSRFFTVEMLKATDAFSDTSIKVADATSKMADSLNKIRDWAVVGKDAIFAFGQDVKSLVAEFYNDSRFFSAEMLRATNAFADTAGKVAGGASAMADSLKKIANWAVVGEQSIFAFGQDVRALVAEFFNDSQKFTADMLKGAATFAETAGKVASAAGTMADSLKKIADWAVVGKDAIFSFGQDVSSLVAEFYNDSQKFTSEMTRAAVAFSDTAGKVADGASKMADSLKKILDWSSVGKDAIFAFGQDVFSLVAEFYNASSKFSAEMLRNSAAFSDTATKVADAASKMADALSKVRNWAAIGQQTIGEFAVDVNSLVSEFVNSSQHFSTTMLKEATLFADTATKVADATSKMADGLNKIRDWAVVGQQATYAFAQDVNSLVAEFFNASTHFQTDMLKGATLFADTASKVADATSKMADGLSKLRNWAAVGQAAISAFGQDVSALVAAFYADSQKFNTDMLKAASTFADTTSKVGDATVKGAAGLTALASFKSVSAAAINAFTQDLLVLVTDFVRAGQTYTAKMLVGANAFSDAAGKAADTLSKGVSGFQALQSYKGIAHERITTFMADLNELVSQFISSSGRFQADALKAAGDYADAAGKVAGVLANGATGFSALQTYKSVAQSKITAFVNDLQDVVAQFMTASGHFSQESLAAAGVFAETAGKVVGVLANGVTGFDALQTYKSVAQNKISTFVNDLKILTGTFVSGANTFSDEGLKAGATFADAAGKIVGVISNGVTGFSALQTYSSVAQGRMQLFVTDMKALVALMLVAAGEFDAEGMKATAAFADAIGKIFSGLKSAVELFTALQKYTSVPSDTISAFIGDVKFTVGLATQMVVVTNTELVAQVAAFGDAIGKIFNGFKSAMDLFKALAEYKSTPSETIQEFIDQVIFTVNLAGQLAAKANTDLMAKANDFLTAAGGIFDKIKSAMDSFKALDAYKSAPSDTAVALIAALVDAINQMGQAVEKAGTFSSQADEYKAKMMHAAQAVTDGSRAMAGAASQASSATSGSGSSGSHSTTGGGSAAAATSAVPVAHYAIGTFNHPGGPALLAERKPELLQTPDGAVKYVKQASFFLNLPAGSKVYNGDQTSAMMTSLTGSGAGAGQPAQFAPSLGGTGFGAGTGVGTGAGGSGTGGSGSSGGTVNHLDVTFGDIVLPAGTNASNPAALKQAIAEAVAHAMRNEGRELIVKRNQARK